VKDKLQQTMLLSFYSNCRKCLLGKCLWAILYSHRAGDRGGNETAQSALWIHKHRSIMGKWHWLGN